MKITLRLLVCFFIVAYCTTCTYLEKEQTYNDNIGETILIELRGGVLSNELLEYDLGAIKDSDLRKTLQKFKVNSIRSVFEHRYEVNGHLKQSIKDSEKIVLKNWFKISLSDQFSSDDLMAEMDKMESVIHTMLNSPIKLDFDATPNDTNFGQQWHLNNSAQPNFDIDAKAAWDINKGRNDVVVAVLDGGVDYNHGDLDPGNRSRVIQGIDTGDGDNDPLDNLPVVTDSYAGHGTKIAGVIGAITNNSNQVSGVMWNCKIMPVKMVRSGSVKIPHIVNWEWSTTAFPADVGAALDYAVVNDADIINLSYSFPDMGWPLSEVITRVPLVAQAIDNAYKNNVVITASMGNYFTTNNSVRYPAGFDEQVIAVGSTNQQGQKSSFSNTGSHINISAPGESILTTDRGGGTTSPNGTSFSAPIVAGVAGLVISHAKDRGGSLTNDDIREILELTATDVGAIGFDQNTGQGIVNARAALELIDQPNTVVQGESVGGTSVLNQSLSQWVLTSGRWGIAAGTYFQVDRYKITKHITFNVPFCNLPNVWMRDRQSRGLSYANPNNGRPFSIISNVTNQGFDVEYVAYYVRYNASGQTLNTWIPNAPAQTKLAYTAVGELNAAGGAGPISGQDLLCSSSTYTVQSLPSGMGVNWTASPSGIASISGSGQTITLTPTSNGYITLSAAITGGCSVPPTITKSIQVGAVNSSQTSVNGTTAVCPGNLYTYQAVVPGGHKPGYTYQWTYPSNWSYQSQSGNQITLYVPSSNPSYGTVRFRVDNGCGYSGYSGVTVFPGYSCGSFPYSIKIYPNPATEEFQLEIEQFDDNEIQKQALGNENFDVEFFGPMGSRIASYSFTERKKTIDVRGLKPGFYYLHIRYKDSIVRKQVRVGN